MDRSKFMIVLVLATRVFLQGQGQWDVLPGPSGGVISQLVSISDGVLFAATSIRLYRSVDTGKTWTQCYYGTIGGLASNSKHEIFLVDGANVLFRSTDLGEHWMQHTTLPFGSTISLGIDPSDNMYIGTASSTLYRSSDAGSTWHGLDITEKFSSIAFYDSVIFAAGSSLWRSTDQGEHWKRAAPFSNVHLQGALLWSFSGKCIYRSSDLGMNWDTVLSVPEPVILTSMSFDRNGSVYAASLTSGVYASSDAGVTWRTILPGVPLANMLHIVACGGTILAGTGNVGVVRSSVDSPGSWQTTMGIMETGFFQILFADDGSLYGVAYGLIFKSSDKGNTWRRIMLNSTGRLFVNIDGSLNVISRLGIGRSTDGGSSWQWFTNGFGGYIPMSAAHDSKGRIYSGTHGMFRLDLGDTIWRKIDSFPGGRSSALLSQLLVDRHDHILVFSALSDSILRSTDEGLTWQRHNYAGFQEMTSMVELGDSLIFSGSSYYGVLVSSDDGVSWNIGYNDGLMYDRGGLGMAGINCIARAPDGSIFLTQQDWGIFRSTNGGRHWEVVDTSVGMGNASGLAFDKEGYLYVGAHTLGLLRSKQPIIAFVSDTRSVGSIISLSQNYPNPFNPTTDIGYRIADLGFVSLKIYNTLGQQVATLVNEVKPPGRYSVTWNAGNNPSGMYFYKLSAGKFVEVKKMVLVR